MHPIHVRGIDGVTHAWKFRHGKIACGASNVPGATITTHDPIDCMTCLSRGFESDVFMSTVTVMHKDP